MCVMLGEGQMTLQLQYLFSSQVTWLKIEKNFVCSTFKNHLFSIKQLSIYLHQLKYEPYFLVPPRPR